MHEDSHPKPWQNNVRATWQILTVQTKPKTGSKQCFADDDFWLRIQSPNTGHHPASGCRIHDVSHGINLDAPLAHLPTVARTDARTSRPCTPDASPTRNHLAVGGLVQALVDFPSPYLDLLQELIRNTLVAPTYRDQGISVRKRNNSHRISSHVRKEC
jgi:hypothetical protein